MDATIESIHEHQYEKLKEPSSETETKKKIRHVQKIKQKYKKDKPNITQKPEDWTKTDVEDSTSLNSMSAPQEERNA